MRYNKKGFIVIALTILALILGILIYISFAPLLSDVAAFGVTQTTDGLTQFEIVALPIVMFLIIIWLVTIRGVS